MDLRPHAAYIWSAYAAVGIGVAVLILWLVFDGRRHQRFIDELEAGGVRRRSDQPGRE